MNNFISTLLGVTLFILLVTGCSPLHNTVVILMPDPDGHVGKAVVSTDGGTQHLETSHEMTTVSTRSQVPTPVSIASSEFITTRFADVMAIEPPPADKFILYFHSGTTDLVSASQALIPTILTAIKQRGAVSITISGHTDSTGSVQLNDNLSRDRANAIKNLLILQGTKAERVTVSSHGKGNQLVPTADGVAEPRNRRVEVIVR